MSVVETQDGLTAADYHRYGIAVLRVEDDGTQQVPRSCLGECSFARPVQLVHGAYGYGVFAVVGNDSQCHRRRDFMTIMQNWRNAITLRIPGAPSEKVPQVYENAS